MDKTKYYVVKEKAVPEVLLSGNHQKIKEWRKNARIWVDF